MFKRIIVNAIDKVCDLELKYITSDGTYEFLTRKLLDLKRKYFY